MTEPNWKPSPQYEQWRGCDFCKHLDRRDGHGGSCAAYPHPGSIPFPFVAGQTDHMIERPGQVPGVLFEDTGETEDDLMALASAEVTQAA